MKTQVEKIKRQQRIQTVQCTTCIQYALYIIDMYLSENEIGRQDMT